jgi:hypothetical protein
MDHMELHRSCPDDPRSGLQLRHRQFRASVRALLECELMLERREPHLPIRQDRLTNDHRQQGTYDHRDRDSVQQTIPVLSWATITFLTFSS